MQMFRHGLAHSSALSPLKIRKFSVHTAFPPFFSFFVLAFYDLRDRIFYVLNCLIHGNPALSVLCRLLGLARRKKEREKTLGQPPTLNLLPFECQNCIKCFSVSYCLLLWFLDYLLIFFSSQVARTHRTLHISSAPSMQFSYSSLCILHRD